MKNARFLNSLNTPLLSYFFLKRRSALSMETTLSVHIVEDPLTAVVRGTGKVLENLNYYMPGLIKSKRY